MRHSSHACVRIIRRGILHKPRGGRNDRQTAIAEEMLSPTRQAACVALLRFPLAAPPALQSHDAVPPLPAVGHSASLHERRLVGMLRGPRQCPAPVLSASSGVRLHPFLPGRVHGPPGPDRHLQSLQRRQKYWNHRDRISFGASLTAYRFCPIMYHIIYIAQRRHGGERCQTQTVQKVVRSALFRLHRCRSRAPQVAAWS